MCHKQDFISPTIPLLLRCIHISAHPVEQPESRCWQAMLTGPSFPNRIRFTVVSEPPEEEEQERECEDVGVAFLRIPDILEKQRDVTEERLSGQHAPKR